MNRQEFGQFVMAMRTYYNKEKLVPNDQAMELWYKQLQEIHYDIACSMLNEWVRENKWSPSISEILSNSKQIEHARKIMALQKCRYNLLGKENCDE